MLITMIYENKNNYVYENNACKCACSQSETNIIGKFAGFIEFLAALLYVINAKNTLRHDMLSHNQHYIIKISKM